MGGRWRIRRAQVADAGPLAALERRCFSDPWSQGAFDEMLRFPPTFALVAERRGELVGYLIARAIEEEAEVLNLAVVPEARRLGLGAELLEEALSALDTAGVREVWLEVRESNLAAQALYQRRGFAAVGRRPQYYRNPREDALVYRLRLKAPQSGTAALD